MKKLLVTTLLLAFVAVALFAVPAMPGFRVFEQPDGSKFIAQLKGDEHFHFGETEDGYAIIRNSEGWWTFAQRVDGVLVPSMFLAGKDQCPFSKGLRPDADAVAKIPSNALKPINWSKFIDINSESEKSGYGDRKFLIILGCFDDSSFLGTAKPANWNINPWLLRSGFTSAKNGGTAHDSLYWDSVFFSYSAGSFRTYFKEISFGRWIIDTMCHVQGPVSVGGSGTTNDYFEYGDGKELTYMQNIIKASSGRMKYGTTRRTDQNAYSDYDGDGDGYVDHWTVVRAGGEQSGSGSTKDMWATTYYTDVSTTTGATVHNPANAGEITDSLSRAWTLTQLLDTTFVRSFTMGIGVDCHESFHAFEAPDLYDYGYQGEPADMFSLMDGGSWNGDGVQAGSRPPHPGAMLQYTFQGWPEKGDTTAGFMPDDWDISITTNGRYPVVGLAADSVKGGPRFYMIKNAAFTTAGEQIFVENRNDKGFFEGIFPENGILITHYDVSEKGTYYNEGQYYTYWIEQRGFDPKVHDLYTADTIYRDASQAPYFAGDDYEYTNLTSAGANANGSTTIFGPYIISVSAPGDTMWFTVDNCTAPAGASFAYKTHTVLDTSLIYANNDGVVSPDEQVDLTIAVKNVGGAANTVVGKLRHKYGLCTVVDSTATYGTIGAAATVTNTADVFRIKVKPGCPEDTILFFTLSFTSSNGANEAEFGIKINSTPTVYTTNLRTVSTSLTDVAGIDVLFDADNTGMWLLFVAGTGLGNSYGTGAKKLFGLTLDDMGATFKDSFNYLGANYMQCMDHDNLNRMWWSSGDSAWCYDFTTGISTPTFVGRMKWSNTDYGGTIMKRFRGVTFDNNDSLYGYWQTYGTFEESLIGQRKVIGSLATRWTGWPLTDGSSYGGKWNNGRGIEWDGTCFWSNNTFENFYYRKSPTTFKNVSTLSGSSVYSNMTTYDIALQNVGSNGELAVPYASGNKYYMWSSNLENSDITKMDVTAVVLPHLVTLVPAACTWSDATNTAKIVWRKNPTNDFATKYIVYHSTDVNFFATSKDSIGTTTDSFLTYVTPNTKGMHYFKVRAVNYQGYSYNTSDVVYTVNNTTAINAVSMIAVQTDNDVVIEWVSEGITNGSMWEVSRKSATNDAFTTVGTVEMNNGKFIDKTVPSNGTYTYKLDLVKTGGAKVTYAEAKIKYFSSLVFGISPLAVNPVKGSFNLNYSIDREQNVTLKVYSITGSCVMTLANGTMKPGVYSSRIDASKIGSGVYYVVLNQGDKEAKTRVTILK